MPTAVAPKFSDALTLFQPGGADYAQHRRGRTKNFPVVTSLLHIGFWSGEFTIDTENQPEGKLVNKKWTFIFFKVKNQLYLSNK